MSADDRTALLAAIRAHPDEDTPRLAYADWLDEQGGKPNAARAAFIRAAVEAARRADDGSPAAAVAGFIESEGEPSLRDVDWSAVDPDLGRRLALQRRLRGPRGAPTYKA